MEPRYNEGSKDWPHLLALKRFRYTCIEVLSYIFAFAGLKNVVRYTDDFVI